MNTKTDIIPAGTLGDLQQQAAGVTAEQAAAAVSGLSGTQQTTPNTAVKEEDEKVHFVHRMLSTSSGIKMHIDTRFKVVHTATFAV